MKKRVSEREVKSFLVFLSCWCYVKMCAVFMLAYLKKITSFVLKKIKKAK